MTNMLTALAAFTMAWAMTRYFCRPDSFGRILDHPGHRSLHTRSTPRNGGIALLSGIIAGFMIAHILGAVPHEAYFLLLAGLPTVAVSLTDDAIGVHPAARILIHILAAALLVWLINRSGPAISGIPRTTLIDAIFVLFVVWMTNLYNFMDGMDGFAGGMAVFGFTTFALLGYLAQAPQFVTVNLLVAAASAGFLVFNFPPARIFMGDTGSCGLGFLAAAFSLWAARDGLIPLWIAVLVFSPFIVDATVTLSRRLVKGEKIWQPHKRHYYQRLVEMGWGHRRTVLAEYLLMAACCLSAILATRLPGPGQVTLALLWVAIYSALMLGVARLERRHSRPISAA